MLPRWRSSRSRSVSSRSGLFLGACYNIIKGKLGLAAIMAIAAFFVGGGVAVLEAA